MAAGDLTNTANVKAQAGTLSAAADAVLQSLITQASSFIATATDRSFTAAASVSEIRHGSGGRELFLAEGPVVSVQSLAVDAVVIPAQVADGQPGYFLVRNEVISLLGYTFCRGRNNVRVTYTAGYAAVPKDIEQACIELVVSAYKRVPRGVDLQSETTPQTGAVISFKLTDVPAYAARAIEQYRKVVPL